MTKDLVFDAPLPSFIERRCTSTIAPRDRFDHWRAWHPSVELTPRSTSAGQDFEARLIRHRMDDGTTFGFTRSGDVDSRFGRRAAADYFLLSRVVSGAAVAQAGKNTLSLDASGRFCLVDGRRPVQITSAAGFSHVYLVLPRAPLIDIAEHDPFPGRTSIVELENRGLLAIADAQLQALLHNLTDLRAPDLAAAVKSIAGIVALGLKRQLGESVDADRPMVYEMVYLSARRVMELHCADPQLTASSIAAAIGCSRAHLYRAFAHQRMSVADVLRDIRLQRAQSLLRAPRRRSLAQIAAQSGFSDPSSFSRAFRAAFGMPPRDWRRIAD